MPTPTTAKRDRLISRNELAEILGVHRASTYRIPRHNPDFPRPMNTRPDGSGSWRRSETAVLDWMERKLAEAKADPMPLRPNHRARASAPSAV